MLAETNICRQKEYSEKPKCEHAVKRMRSAPAFAERRDVSPQIGPKHASERDAAPHRSPDEAQTRSVKQGF
jgi:hypothetical protein